MVEDQQRYSPTPDALAEAIAASVMYHIREMYPAARAAMPLSGAVSLRNAIIMASRRRFQAYRESGAARGIATPSAEELLDGHIFSFMVERGA